MKTIQQSSAYQRAEGKAEQYLRNKEKLSQLFADASQKANRLEKHRPLNKIWDELATIVRLIRVFLRGDYREFPTCSLLLIIAGLLYFVWPIDFSPDAIPLVGMLDDVTLLAWIINSVRHDMDAFRKWEASQHPEDRQPVRVIDAQTVDAP
ncbi:MAG: DUF1232 domain-containing protein [Planctomycetaceae bacterium]|nr:DUF1232 domain-containing protein [Planctomycetaceae bacterium]